MRRQPLLILLVCFAAGILVEENFALDKKWIYLFLIISALSLILILIKNFWIQKIKNGFLWLFFFALGIFSHSLNSQKPELQTFEGKQNFAFQLKKKLNSSEKYRRYEVGILKIGENNSDLNAVISIPKSYSQLTFENYYQAEAYLNLAESPRNNFQFDYAKYLSRKKIYYQSFINSAVKSSPKDGLTFSDKIRQKRVEKLATIDQSELQPKTREFLKGIILADRTEMDAETVADFSRSGLVHLLAISGSHMVIIFWLVMLLLKKVTPTKFRLFPIVISLILIWLFAIFIDYGSSVMRSCIMITAYYMFQILQRKPDLLHAMALAGFTILIVDTHQFFDVGFQLSFLAVLGIFWLNQPILSFFGDLINKYWRFFANVISVSLSAQIATLPLLLYYFHQYSLLSIVANLVVIPFSEIIIIFSLLMTVLFAFKVEFSWLDTLYNFMVDVLLKTIHWFAGIESLFIKNISVTVVEAVLLLIAFYFLRKIFLRKSLQAAVPFATIFLLFLFLRTGLNFYNFKKDETFTANYFNQKILIVKRKDEVNFFVKEKSNIEKIKKYLVEPYLSSRRIHQFQIHEIPAATQKIAVNGKSYDLE